MKVLVLEKHSERGGQTHVFRRDGASWDVGLHYVGELDKGSIIRTVIDFLSGGALEWNKMTDEFERFLYPGLHFAVPSDPARYQQRLIERFPDEARAIRSYFRDLRAVASWHVLGIQQQFLPQPLAFLFAQWRRLGAAKATQTTAEYLRRHFRSPRAQSLARIAMGRLRPAARARARSRCMPSSSTAISTAPGFLKAAPGASRARSNTGIEASGGAIKVSHEVTAILTEGGRAVGVKAHRSARRRADRSRLSRADRHFRRRRARSPIGGCCRPTARSAGGPPRRAPMSTRLEGGLSMVTLYLRLAEPVSTLGVKGENYWINTTFDHDDLDAATAATLAGEPRHAYLSFPSAKSGDDRFHTAEVITSLRPEAFAAWRGSATGQRGRDYVELKNRIAEGLLNLADSAVPGLKALTRYSELSTPLTMEDFTSHPGGRLLRPSGNAGALSLRARFPRARRSPASISAAPTSPRSAFPARRWAALPPRARFLGAFGFAAHHGGGATDQDARRRTPTRSAEKKRATLVAKTALTPSIWRLEFELDEPIRFVPGQYVKLRVAPFEWRDYSIAAAAGKRSRC